MPKATYENTLTEHILLKRIPTPPFGDIRDRHIVEYDEYVNTGGYEGLRKALTMKPGDVTQEVKDAVLRGRGGAGFPAGVKWSFLPEPDGGRRYLAVNADESEPGTFKDRLLMDFDPHGLLEGIAICMHACRLDTAYIYIRGEYHHQAHVLEHAIKEAYEHGIFGESGLLNQSSTPRASPWWPTAMSTAAPGRTSAARRRGCSRGSRASAAGRASSRPSRRSRASSTAPRSSTTSRRSHLPASCRRRRVVLRAGRRVERRRTAQLRHQAHGRLGHVEPPGCYEFELGIPLRELVEEHCGGIRGGKKYKGAIPGGVSMGILGHGPVRRRDGFRHRRKYNVLGPGHGVADRLRRGHRHGRGRPQHRPVLQARELRAVHALPRGLGLALPTHVPHRGRRRPRPRTSISPSRSPPWAPCRAPRSAGSPTATTGRRARSSTQVPRHTSSRRGSRGRTVPVTVNLSEMAWRLTEHAHRQPPPKATRAAPPSVNAAQPKIPTPPFGDPRSPHRRATSIQHGRLRRAPQLTP